MTIPEALHKFRKQHGLSQDDLAERTGIQQRQISKIETGNADPRLSSLVTLARALETELLLIPRSMLPAIEALLNTEASQALDAPAWRLDGEADDDD